MSTITRRHVLAGAGGLAATAVGAAAWRIQQQPPATVYSVRQRTYEDDLTGAILDGLRAFPRLTSTARNARVVLKPNLVEYNPLRPINTDPRIVVATALAFRQLGAAAVIVAEGPGHRRDTELLVTSSGLGERLDAANIPFVDLNVDAVDTIALPLNKTGLREMQIGQTITRSDVLVSLAKLKTHHWAGATLSMKNLFGTVPGRVYGWPKNPLHWAGIDASIVDLWSALRPSFAIIDGVIGMDGDGPIMGNPQHTGVIVMGENLPAVDATAARIMGIRPTALSYLEQSSWFGGTISKARISSIGDEPPQANYDVVEHLSWIKSR